MELLYWNPVNRKRSKNTPCTSPDYVKGYDIDVHDMTALVAKFNRQQLLPSEELRLYDHVRTLINIIFENPKINPRNSQEKEECADFIFVDCWGAMRYVKSGANPFIYIYRLAIFTVRAIRPLAASSRRRLSSGTSQPK